MPSPVPDKLRFGRPKRKPTGLARDEGSVRHQRESERVDLTNVRRLHEAGVFLATDTDRMLPMLRDPGVHVEMEMLVRAGLTQLEAIRAATLDAAKCLGADREMGSVEVGTRADFIIVDGEPERDVRDARRIVWNIRESELLTREDIRRNGRPAP